MTQERIERLFLSQQEWEAGEIGGLCIQGTDQAELQRMFERRQFVLQFFLGFLRPGQLSLALVPSCENLHTTQPSAWTVDSLTGMPAEAFARCLELIGQDPFLTQYQLTQLLSKVKKIYGPVSSFSPSVIAQLGRIALRLSDDELRLLNLSELSSIATFGAVDGWSPRQLSILFSSVLNSTKLSPNQLDSSTLVALGHIVCGIKTSDMQNLKAVELSKAVLWLGRLRLLCSEEQLQVLVGLLSNSLAFGHIGSWGPEVFIEIGSLAAGLPDIAMSALVKDQIEGITPLAISLVPDKKFAVAFNQAQIRTFTYEQAVAVTEAQRAALSTVQQTALSMVLTPWEDKPVDFRGNYSSNTPPLVGAADGAMICYLQIQML
ncbi:stereocilin [Scleropages formosus]|uniref:stereocilin n=1 Tax=Scleropages formosus TaxID=113540 RepID=UPI00087845BA|nr:stereocilin-like [Scleropages formosus]